MALLCAGACDARITIIGALNRDAAAPAEPDPEPGRYIEAEAGQLSAGFTIEDDANASAAHYLAPATELSSEDAPGAARARYSISITQPGNYVIWGRIRSPDVASNRFWIQVDGGTWYKWRISVGDIWYWDRLHDDRAYDTALNFPFSAGEHALVIANCVPGVALDRLYVTAGDEVPPGNDTPCRPPHSIEIAGQCLPSCGSQSGTTCSAPDCAGKPLLGAYDCDVCCRGDTKM
jgi:hypothetical protein